ncbi:MAG: amidohydrolase [Deltaproteobacteria bacterium]|nr:amidohydrolase [Deltaproteobacteria bacterium]
MLKIDVYAHITPQKFIDAFAKRSVSWEVISGIAPAMGNPTLTDLSKRLEVMDRYEDYVQVLTPTGQVIEPWYGPGETPELSQIFNDAVAEIIAKHPDKFIAGVAQIPINNIDASLKEIERTIEDLHFKGILLHTPIYQYEEGKPGYNYETMKPIDLPEFMPIYELMDKYNLPIWIHPVGSGGVPVYKGEARGMFGLSHMLGWPIESAVAMGRIISRGILEKYPKLKFIIHHCGSGLVPALIGRIANDVDKFRAANLLKGVTAEADPFKDKNAADYYRMFYADTSLYGDTSGLMCGYDLFGPEHILFGTDFPYDRAGGDKFTKKTIDAVYKMTISDSDKKMIFEDNARRIMKLDR